MAYGDKAKSITAVLIEPACLRVEPITPPLDLVLIKISLATIVN